VAGHDRTTKEGKKFFKELDELLKLQVRIGFQHGENVNDDDADLVDIAAWNELGTVNMPSRPFMRQSVDNNKSSIISMCKAQLKAVAHGKSTAQETFQKIGVMQKGLVQKTIRDGEFEENAPGTIRQKGSDTPLIDTGHMRQSVDFVIKPRKG